MVQHMGIEVSSQEICVKWLILIITQKKTVFKDKEVTKVIGCSAK